MTNTDEIFDVVVVGGGPAGATAATELAGAGRRVALLDMAGRIKPCGGAIPNCLMERFDIPTPLLAAKALAARIISPADRRVQMPIDTGFVGMVDRATFDPWLRKRAYQAGATRIEGAFKRFMPDDGRGVTVEFTEKSGGALQRVRARAVIGADGANSAVARSCFTADERAPHVFAYHEIVRAPRAGTTNFNPHQCDVFYSSEVSPDFYGWVFPHGDTISIGTGSALKGFSLRQAVTALRARVGLADAETIRCEGAPIPLRPLARWDNGKNLVLAGDAAGAVAPASGEGIFYAMTSGRLAAESIDEFLTSDNPKALGSARKRFMREHGMVFRVLGVMQGFWYRNDSRREHFVAICRDPDVQRLTWESYLDKKLSRTRPVAHVKIFFKNLAHMSGLARV